MVILILGVLAAIAVPLLVGQRQRAADTVLKSDLRVVAGAVEGQRAEGTGITEAELRSGLRLSPGSVIEVFLDGDDYCLLATRSSGVGSTQPWIYSSGAGLGRVGEEVCSGASAFVLP